MPENSSNKQPSSRQMEVLALVLEGLTNKEIGSRLRISERAVKHHISRLFLFFDASNRAELIAKILRRKS